MESHCSSFGPNKQLHTQLFCKTIYEKFGKIDILFILLLAIPVTVETISENDIIKYFKQILLTQRLIKLVHPLLKTKDSIAVFVSDNTKKQIKNF